MPEQNSTPAPAQSFAQRFIAKHGRWLCFKCNAIVRANDLPHDCRSYAKPYGAR